MSSPTDASNRYDAGVFAGIREHLTTGQRYEQAGACERALAAYRAALDVGGSLEELAEAHLRLARVHRAMASWDAAIVAAREAVRLADATASDDLAAEAMNVEVGVHQLRGDFAAGHALAEQAIARARSPRVRGILLQNRGAMSARAGAFADAEGFFAESVEAFRAAGYDLGMAMALANGSAAALDAGDPPRALHLARQSATIARRLEANDVLVLALQNQAHALVELERLDDAEAILWETFGHFATTGNTLRQAECLEVLGALHARREESHEEAIRCWDRATAMAQSVGDRLLCERIATRRAALGGGPGTG